MPWHVYSNGDGMESFSCAYCFLCVLCVCGLMQAKKMRLTLDASLMKESAAKISDDVLSTRTQKGEKGAKVKTI